MRILVAEDDPISRRFMVALLQKQGFAEVAVAANGKQAAETCASCDFDCVFMDIQMPEMDGFEATRIIREEERRRGKQHVPIVACTAHAIAGYRERCLAAGMDDFMTKPFDRQQLTQMVVSFSPLDLN